MPKVVHIYVFEGLAGLDSFVFSHAPGRVSTCCRCVFEVTRWPYIDICRAWSWINSHVWKYCGMWSDFGNQVIMYLAVRLWVAQNPG